MSCNRYHKDNVTEKNIFKVKANSLMWIDYDWPRWRYLNSLSNFIVDFLMVQEG